MPRRNSYAVEAVPLKDMLGSHPEGYVASLS